MAKRKTKSRPEVLMAEVVEVKDPTSKKTTPKNRPATQKESAIVLTEVNTQSLIAGDRRLSLAAWFSLYLQLEVGAPEEGEPATHTFKAKKADLEKFLAYLTSVAGDDHLHGWTKAVSKKFVTWLAKQKVERTGKPYASSTVDRVLATLRHASKWIHGQQKFLAGNPMEKVKDTSPRERPPWKGLDDDNNEEVRLRSAAEQLTKIQVRKNQRPYRNYALLVVGINSALRPSELLELDLSQYDGKGFSNVRTKGNQIVRRVPISKEAADAINDYLEQERGDQPGPLFQSKTGKRFTIQRYGSAMKAIAKQANSRLPEDQQINVWPHLLRHTGLRKLCRKNGIEFAKKRSNHVSDKHIWRYVDPTDAEFEAAIESVDD